MRPSVALSGICLATLLLLGSCGWHVRGTQEMPDGLRQLRLVSAPESAALVQKLQRSLSISDEQLESTAGTPTLHIGIEQRLLRTVALDASARSAEQEMRLVIEFQLHDGSDTLIYGPEELSVSRVYAYNPNQVIAKQDEERLIYQELQDALVAQLIRQLARVRIGETQPAAAAAAH